MSKLASVTKVRDVVARYNHKQVAVASLCAIVANNQATKQRASIPVLFKPRGKRASREWIVFNLHLAPVVDYPFKG